MCGCKEQKYSYVPGVVNVNENLSSVSSAFDLKNLPLETTVWGVSSSLIHVTVVPAFTAVRCGANAKLLDSHLRVRSLHGDGGKGGRRGEDGGCERDRNPDVLYGCCHGLDF